MYIHYQDIRFMADYGAAWMAAKTGKIDRGRVQSIRILKVQDRHYVACIAYLPKYIES